MKKITVLIFVFLPILLLAKDSLTNSISDFINETELIDNINEPSKNKFDLETQVPGITIQNNIPDTKTDYLYAIIPLLTLILGFVLNKWYDNYTTRKKQKETGSQWIVNFIQLSEPLKNQILSMQKYIPLNDENHFKITNPSFEISLDCDVFRTLDSNSIIPYFNKGKNKISYKEAIILAGNLKNTIKIIEQNSDEYKKQINVMKHEVSNHISLFNPIFNDFKILVNEYWNYVNEEHSENAEKIGEAKKMYDLMMTHVLPYIESGEFDLFKLGNEFIKPFFKATFLDREDQKIQEINRLLNLCDMHIKAIKMEKKYFKIRLEKVLECYQIQLERISEITSNPKITKP